jgi:hypothetical protein
MNLVDRAIKEKLFGTASVEKNNELKNLLYMTER